jgi:hypothetical protein
MRRLLLVLPLLLGACVSPAFLPTTPAAPPAEGLAAMQFLRTVRLDGAVGNRWEFPAGAVFVADRARDADGAQLWCGTMVIYDLVPENRPICFTRNGTQVAIAAEIRGGGWERTLPEGSFRDFRLR